MLCEVNNCDIWRTSSIEAQVPYLPYLFEQTDQSESVDPDQKSQNAVFDQG